MNQAQHDSLVTFNAAIKALHDNAGIPLHQLEQNKLMMAINQFWMLHFAFISIQPLPDPATFQRKEKQLNRRSSHSNSRRASWMPIPGGRSTRGRLNNDAQRARWGNKPLTRSRANSHRTHAQEHRRRYQTQAPQHDQRTRPSHAPHRDQRTRTSQAPHRDQRTRSSRERGNMRNKDNRRDSPLN